MDSTKPTERLSRNAKECLLLLTAEAIRYGLMSREPLPVHPSHYPAELTASRCSFVSLQSKGTLRGCVGSLESTKPLVLDVVDNAFLAAFRDPRFSPLSANELEELDIHISVLGPFEPIGGKTEEDLLLRLRPGIDGLVIQKGKQRTTFLPSVWESLPTPEMFLRQLKSKAGWPEDYWSDAIVAHRYTTERIP